MRHANMRAQRWPLSKGNSYSRQAFPAQYSTNSHSKNIPGLHRF